VKIGVLVSQVPDPNAVRLDPRAGSIQAGIPQVPNEYDLYAMEAAIQLQERGGEVELVVVTLGAAKDTINRCLAMGADRAITIDDPISANVDSAGTSVILAAVARAEGFDLLLVGQETSDGGTGTVGPELAALLDLPVVSNVVALSEDGGTLSLEREVEDGRQRVEVALPAVVCALSGLTEPRHPSLKGIMGARRKPAGTRSLEDLGLDPEAVPSRVSWGALYAEQEKAAGIILHDVDPDAAVDQLMAFLRERKLI